MRQEFRVFPFSAVGGIGGSLQHTTSSTVSRLKIKRQSQFKKDVDTPSAEFHISSDSR